MFALLTHRKSMTKICIFYENENGDRSQAFILYASYVTDAVPVVMQPLMNDIYLYHVISFVSFPHNSIWFCMAGTERGGSEARFP